ncbi:MAG: sporulation protein YunB [Clostridia bacterium]|nr:sporulation protein YunB [Clostridia bacterium]
MKRWMLCLLLLMGLAGTGLRLLERKVEPLILLCAVSEAQNAARTAAGKAVEEAMEETGATYGKLIALERKGDGTVTACRTDAMLVNRIRSLVTEKLEAYFRTDGADISFPIGNIFGGGILYARGPGVSFRVLPVGRILCDYESQYSSCGINQTRHELTLAISMKISVIGARESEEVDAEGRFPIAETIIIGYVPEHYTGMDIGN